MKQRLPYIIAAIVLFVVEVLIAMYAHDRFVRPYLGDVLVVILLCCCFRAINPNRPKWLALWVFLLGVGVEFLQLWGISQRLDVEGTVWGIVIGSSYSTWDIVCYFCGCAAFVIFEKMAKKRSLME